MGQILCGWASAEAARPADDDLADISPMNENANGASSARSDGGDGAASESDKDKGSSDKSMLDKNDKKFQVNVHTKEYSEEKDVWRCALGAGCYWGTEAFMKNRFPKQPNLPSGELFEGAVGFMGPKSAPANPDYALVCTGMTKHVEVYDVKFKGGADYFEAMLKYYFSFHDPTTRDRQGGDRGTQYASVVFCYNKAQYDIATRVKSELQDHLNKRRLGRSFASSRIFTDVRMVEAQFYPAHLDHQEYLDKNPGGYCNHGIKFKAWPTADDESEVSAAE